MKLYRIFAIVERDMRKFFRNPMLMIATMIFPLTQLIVLGYAFGGKIKGVEVGLVNQDNGPQSRLIRQRLDDIATGPKTFHAVEYGSLPEAVSDLRTGFVRAVIYIPPDYSRRVQQRNRPRIAFIEDNTDNFMSNELHTRMQELVADVNGPQMPPLLSGADARAPMMQLPPMVPSVDLQVVEVYPYIEYIKYLLSGSIAMSIFIVAMIGGGIVFIDDKARGLHEGYLVTPVGKGELILGLISAGALKACMAGMTITIIGGLIAGIERLWDPVRLLYLVIVVVSASLAMISLMFLVMVRVSDPMVPRAIFGVLNTLLFFPSGAIYPIAGFPPWLRSISYVDPFSYTVHALKNLLLKDTGFAGIYTDVAILLGFATLMIAASISLFKRQI
jgi:ABC-type multidrug transport system permease subunit